MSVINYPNLAGTACNYVDSAIYLNGSRASMGLPNPSFTGEWKLETESNLTGALAEVYDDTGRILFSARIASAITDISLNIAPGIYFLRITTDRGMMVEKMVK